MIVCRLLPLPGEFHFEKHVLMALHILWWPALIHWVVWKTSREKTIKQVWTSIEACHHYDFLYMLVIVTLVDHLVEVVPPPLLLQPDLLLHRVRDNAAAVHAIRFLYEYGLPWLALRQAIRGNRAAVINVMWPLTYHWFAVTGKTNYRIMSVVVTYITYAMHPALAVIWFGMRTASLSGYPGRNVAWDFVCERYNRMSKQALGTNVTRERLLQYLPILNTFRHVWPRFLRAMGRADSEASDYSHITAGDRATLADAWREALGPDFATLCRKPATYAFHVPDDDDDDGGGGGGGGGGDGGDGGGDGGDGGGRRKRRKSRGRGLRAVLQSAAADGVPPDPWEVMNRHAQTGELAADSDADDDDMDGFADGTEWEVETIEDARGDGEDREYYVKWRGYPASENSWEPREHLGNCKDLLDEFDRRKQRKRSSGGAAAGPSRDGGDSGDNSGGDDGDSSDDDDPDAPNETKVSHWWVDVTTVLKKYAPAADDRV